MKWILVVFLLVWGLTARVQAQTATSESYFFEMGELLEAGAMGVLSETSTGSAQMPNYGAALSNLAGFWENFPYATVSASAIRMSIDNLSVDFGGMTPAMLVQRQNQLLVNSNIAVGYSLYAQQDHPLVEQNVDVVLADERSIIPDTECDDGTCTVENAAEWNQDEVAGFGYTVMAADGLSDFENGAAYRPFPARSRKEGPALIAQETDTSQLLSNRTLTVQYQVGVSASNVAGLYTNAVNYTLVPHF